MVNGKLENMKNLIKSVLVVLASVLAACSSNTGFVVEGTVAGVENKTVYLEKITGQAIVIDSFQISDNGKFKFVGTAEKPGIYRLNFSNVRALDLVLDNTSKVEVNIDAKMRMDEYEVKGSEASLKIKEINKILYDTYKVVEGLQNEYAAMADEISFAKRHPTGQNDVGLNLATGSNDHFRSDQRIGTDLDILS